MADLIILYMQKGLFRFKAQTGGAPGKLRGRERGCKTCVRLLGGPGVNGSQASIKCLRNDLKSVRGAAAGFYPCYTETSQK